VAEELKENEEPIPLPQIPNMDIPPDNVIPYNS